MLDEPAHVVDGRAGREAVPDVEDVTGAAAGALEHVVDPGHELAPRDEERCWVRHRASVAGRRATFRDAPVRWRDRPAGRIARDAGRGAARSDRVTPSPEERP